MCECEGTDGVGLAEMRWTQGGTPLCSVGMTRSGQPLPELFLVLYAELFCLVTVVSSELLQQLPSPFYSLLTPALYIHKDISQP